MRNSNTVHRLSQGSHRGQGSRRGLGGLTLLYEDSDILVVNKPAGLLSIATGSRQDRTVYWILAEYLRKKGEKRRPAMVHRLDRDTSGVMLLVKSARDKKQFMENWNDMVLTRRYTALVEGTLPTGEGSIDAPLGEDSSGRVIVRQGGKPAVTRWKLLTAGSLRQGRSLHTPRHVALGGSPQLYSLLELELETGRRNQIRAHLAHIGHPVAGDLKYHARSNPIDRLCLHARTIVFRHPGNGKVLTFDEPLKFAELVPLPPR
jgi:23S rRNA pseudouridine1911/1915/1917 synthase